MNKDTIRKIIGFFVFAITLIVYFMTVQPSVSFWDCGEFIASANLLQVPHPPGTPLFLLVGRLLAMIPFADNIGFRVNTISVVTSAFTILFLYLSAIKLIENFKKYKDDNILESVFTYLAAAIGALSLAFSDTFWFNAMEAEVYATATFFIAIVTWLMLVWNEKADETDNEKYLLMIAYLVGLSTGVHLMSVLALVSIVMVIYNRKYLTNEEDYKKTAYVFLGHVAVILIIAAGLWASTTNRPPSLEEYKAFDSKFLMIAVFASVVVMGVFFKKIFHKNSIYIPIIIGGVVLFSVYPGIVKMLPNLLAKIAGNNDTMALAVLIGIFLLLGYLINWSSKENKQTIHLISKSLLFALIGFSSYSMIIIRSNQDTPINLNTPKTFPTFVKYMNREQYGDQPIFKRRFTHESHQQGVYTNYSSDLDFFWRYQMDHMFNRYLLWNYAGRSSTVQDAGVNWKVLFGIPFFLAIFGIYYHFKKDWKMASIFLVMFIFLGYLTAFYQNQQQPQPRERDYFYVGAFFVFSLWLALGIRGILDLIKESLKERQGLLKPIYSGLIIFLIILVPVNMLKANYFTHDRSKNFVPWDYSYNILQSAAPNSIIFTNGDNDTFPLWYLQDVEGVRRDVRIANLSLLNTPWYILQLKNTNPFGTKKIKMSFPDEQINRMGPMQWKTKTIEIPISKKTYEKYGITDTNLTKAGKISWKMKPAINFGKIQAVRVQDLVAMDIIKNNIADRPIYFAVTTPDNSKLGINDYLKMEGLAFKVLPVKAGNFYQAVNEEIMWKQLMEEPESFSRDYKPGFKFRGLNDSTIFFDDNHIRLTLNYRNSYVRLALHYLYVKKDNDKVIEILDMMNKKMPKEIIPIDYRFENDIANIYFSVGAIEQYKYYARDVEKHALAEIERNPLDVSSDYNPYFILKQIYDNLKEYDKFLDVLRKLKQAAPNDSAVDRLIKQYQDLANKSLPEVPKQN